MKNRIITNIFNRNIILLKVHNQVKWKITYMTNHIMMLTIVDILIGDIAREPGYGLTQ